MNRAWNQVSQIQKESKPSLPWGSKSAVEISVIATPEWCITLKKVEDLVQLYHYPQAWLVFATLTATTLTYTVLPKGLFHPSTTAFSSKRDDLV